MRQCEAVKKCQILVDAWDPSKPNVQQFVMNMAMVHSGASAISMPKVHSDLVRTEASLLLDTSKNGITIKPNMFDKNSFESDYQ